MVRPTTTRSHNLPVQHSPSPTKNPVYKYVAETKSFEVGGTGKLFAAKCLSTNETVAIKVMDLSKPSIREAFENETRILKRMSGSSFVIPMKESFIFKGNGYIVMNMLHQDLYTRSQDFQTVEEIRFIIHQICLAVEELHQKNISHLDIKPENILLDREDNVKICDFGSSHQGDGYSKFFKFVGSDYYLAPEVFSHKFGYDSTKADIWSLGVMFHVLLTGVFPFGGITEEDSMSNYFTSTLCFKDLARECNGYPGVFALVSSMLQRNPDKRPTIHQVLSSEWFVNVEEEVTFSF